MRAFSAGAERKQAALPCEPVGDVFVERIVMSDEPRRDLEPRALPDWAWGLALICHPPGLFIALAAARAIRWSTALVLALVSWLIMAAFVYGMMVMESEGGENPVLLGMGAYFVAVGYVQYRFGLRADLWTDRAIRLWRKVGCVAILCAVVAVLVLIGIGVRALTG